MLPVDELEEIACAFRDTAAAVFEEETGETLYWEESVDGAYAAASPGWDGWYALLLCAMADDTGLPLPTPHKDWLKTIEEQPLWKTASDPQFVSHYPTLLANAELFFPSEAEVVMEGPDPTGEQIVGMGCSGPLLCELARLNDRLWQADEATIAAWLTAEAVDMASLGKRGFSALWQMAHKSMALTQPIRLDY